jgi:Bifunctional DNA primase/polymerase, N-terminal
MNSPSLALTSVQEPIINLNLSNLTTTTETQKHDPSPFERAARVLIERGVPVIPLRPGTKVAFQSNWTELASTDPKQIGEWGEQYPEANVASVAKAVPGGVWFFEVDAPNFHKVIEKQTRKKIPNTFTVKSSERRGHFYFKHNADSIAMGNLQSKIDGKEAWSVRADNRYVVGPGSIHPLTQKPYTILVNAPLVEAPDCLIEWFLKNNSSDSVRVNASPDGPPIPHGSHDTELFRIACMLRNAGMDFDQIRDNLVTICEKRCTGHGSDYVEMCERKAKSACKYPVGQASLVPVFGRVGETKTGQFIVAIANDSAESKAIEPITDEDVVPEFDESVITGIYRDIVTLSVAGTTIPPQFAFLNAKIYFGARLAGKATFEGLDCDSCYYGTAIGITGTSKGESWRRTIEKILCPEFLNLKQQLKIIYSADSGAGLKDCFFEPPHDSPVVCYVDEVTTLGHKAGEKKNPEILDAIIELADSHRVSRVLAKKGKQGGSKTHDNARLSLYACGQDGPAFMSAFAGRTKLGLFDRLYPEFSGPIEAGDLPEIAQADVLDLHKKISALNFDAKMTMSDTTRVDLSSFWNTQPVELRRKIRFKKYLMLDMYMAAFGRGVTVAEAEDLAVAIEIFNRQMIIRRVHFTGEVPDRVGYYIGHLKKWTESMRKRLVKGEAITRVAMSLRDFQTQSNAFRDNEVHVFNQAWRNYHEAWLAKTRVTGANGHLYEKFIPVPREDETWAPLP